LNATLFVKGTRHLGSSLISEPPPLVGHLDGASPQEDSKNHAEEISFPSVIHVLKVLIDVFASDPVAVGVLMLDEVQNFGCHFSRWDSQRIRRLA
jgi:hypothetical protein